MTATITAAQIDHVPPAGTTEPASARAFAPRCIVHAAENIKGGVGTYLRELLDVQRRSFGPGVVAALVPASQREILGYPPGVKIVTFDDSGHRLLNTWRLALKMRALVSREKPLVVHLHSTFAGAALRPLLRAIRSEAAVVYCAHGWAFDRETSRASRLFAQGLERVLARWCDGVICISEHEMRAAKRIGILPQKLMQVSNGIPRESPRTTLARTRADWPEGTRRVLFVGRFDRQKGIDLLLEAMAELGDTAFAYVVGDSVLGDARTHAIPPNVRTTGWLSGGELEAFYQSADVLVVPSRWEGFGLNAAEAMRASLPVIASRVGGLQEVVEDGVTGLLLPPGEKNALVRALRDISDERLAAMGRAGRQRFLRRFTLDRVHEQLIGLYQRCVTSRDAASE
ncbi:MAG: glycosyltransferase [Gammaproteobacteria bacterium]